MSSQPHPLLKAHLALFIAACLWSTAYVGIRVALESFTPGAAALLRYAIASICMLIFYFRPRQVPRKLPLKLIPLMLLIGMVGIGVYNITLNNSELSISASCAAFVIGQVPVLTAVLAMIFYREKLSAVGWLGLGVCVIGTILLSLGEASAHAANLKGLCLILMTALISSFYGLSQKPILKQVDPFDFVSFAIWGGTFVLSAYAPALLQQLPLASTASLAWGIFIGIFPAAIAYALWSYGLAQIPISKAITYLYFTPLLTLLLGEVVLHEPVALLAITGGLITLAGTFVVNRSKLVSS